MSGRLTLILYCLLFLLISDKCKNSNNWSAGLARTRLLHSWARETEGGWLVCRTLSDSVRCQRAGFDALGWAHQVPSGFCRVPYGSVHQSYTTTGQSSDPSSRVGVTMETRRADPGPTGSSVRMAREDPTGPDRSLECSVSVFD